MTTDAQERANRQNALRSTGPKSRAGKAKVACNAFRHGLSVPITALPDFEAPIARLAKLLAAFYETPIEAASEVAISMIELARIERMKTDLLLQLQNGSAPRVLADLHSLERYERRARSKRKFAVRRFGSSRTCSMPKASSHVPSTSKH